MPTVQEVRNLAVDTFDSPQRAEAWLLRRNIVLECTPNDIIGTEEGREKIYTILMRIQHGVFS